MTCFCINIYNVVHLQCPSFGYLVKFYLFKTNLEARKGGKSLDKEFLGSVIFEQCNDKITKCALNHIMCIV